MMDLIGTLISMIYDYLQEFYFVILMIKGDIKIVGINKSIKKKYIVYNIVSKLYTYYVIFVFFIYIYLMNMLYYEYF